MPWACVPRRADGRRVDWTRGPRARVHDPGVHPRERAPRLRPPHSRGDRRFRTGAVHDRRGGRSSGSVGTGPADGAADRHGSSRRCRSADGARGSVRERRTVRVHGRGRLHLVLRRGARRRVPRGPAGCGAPHGRPAHRGRGSASEDPRASGRSSDAGGRPAAPERPPDRPRPTPPAPRGRAPWRSRRGGRGPVPGGRSRAVASVLQACECPPRRGGQRRPGARPEGRGTALWPHSSGRDVARCGASGSALDGRRASRARARTARAVPLRPGPLDSDDRPTRRVPPSLGSATGRPASGGRYPPARDALRARPRRQPVGGTEADADEPHRRRSGDRRFVGGVPSRRAGGRGSPPIFHGAAPSLACLHHREPSGSAVRAGARHGSAVHEHELARHAAALRRADARRSGAASFVRSVEGHSGDRGGVERDGDAVRRDRDREPETSAPRRGLGARHAPGGGATPGARERAPNIREATVPRRVHPAPSRSGSLAGSSSGSTPRPCSTRSPTSPRRTSVPPWKPPRQRS